MRTHLVSTTAALLVATTASAQERCSVDGQAGDMTGERGSAWVIQRNFDSLRVCVLAGEMLNAGDALPSDWVGRAPVVVLETRLGNDVRVMRLAGATTTYSVNGASRQMDRWSNEWMRAVLDVMDADYRLQQYRAREAALKGELDAVKGQRGKEEVVLSAEDLAAKRTEYEALKVEWRGLAAKLSEARAQQGRINSDIRQEQSFISNLQSQMATASAAERRRINQDIQRHNQEIRRLTNERRQYDLDVQSIESRARTTDFERTLRRLERELGVREDARSAATADTTSRASAIEGQLEALEAQRRRGDFETRRSAAVARLRTTLVP